MVIADGDTGRGWDKQTVFMCNTWKKRNERPNVGGVSIRSRNGAPSRGGCVVHGQVTKQATNEYAPPPASPWSPLPGCEGLN